MTLRSKLLGVTLSSLMVTTIFTVPAFAEPSTLHLHELEAKLEESLRQIQALSNEVKNLKQQAPAQISPVVSNTEVDERLEELEITVEGLDERVGSRSVVSAFSAESIDLGGFLHTTFTHVNGEDGTASSFNRNIFELLLRADLNDQWSAFIAQAFLRQSGPQFTDAEGRRTPAFGINIGPVATDTPLAWVNYKHNDAFNVRFGRFLAPQGIINIEHFPALLLEPEQPQFLRPFGGDTLFANFLTGVQLHGDLYFDNDNSLEWSAFTANFTGNDEKLITGGRLAYGFDDLGVTVGLNGQFGERRAATDSDFSVYGADLLIDKGPVLWKTEIFASSEDAGDDRFAFYTQPAWRLNDKWAAFYRYDFLDNGGTTGDTTENVLGINYLPVPNLRLRATATLKDFDAGIGTTDANAEIYQLSATFNF